MDTAALNILRTGTYKLHPPINSYCVALAYKHEQAAVSSLYILTSLKEEWYKLEGLVSSDIFAHTSNFSRGGRGDAFQLKPNFSLKGSVSRILRWVLLYINRKLSVRPIIALNKILILLKGQFTIYKKTGNFIPAILQVEVNVGMRKIDLRISPSE